MGYMEVKIRMVIAVLLTFSIGAFGQKPTVRRTVTKEMAIEMVMQLHEVKEAKAYVLRHSRDKRKLLPMIYGEPTKEQPYWWVVVGEYNGMSFVTHFGFLVYIRTRKIYYYDALEGKSIDLQTWRKNGRKR